MQDFAENNETGQCSKTSRVMLNVEDTSYNKTMVNIKLCPLCVIHDEFLLVFIAEQNFFGVDKVFLAVTLFSRRT